MFIAFTDVMRFNLAVRKAIIAIADKLLKMSHVA